MTRIVQVSAVAIFNLDGELLTVRKAGTQRFQLPGGKPDSGETPLEAALREVQEEVGLELPASSLSALGHWQGEAANDDADLVSAQVYLAAGIHQALARAEIAELRWLDLAAEETPDLAPLISLFLLPILRAMDLPLAR